MIKRTFGYLTIDQESTASPASQQLQAEGYTLLKNVFSKSEVDDLAAEILQVFEDIPFDHRSASRSEAANEMFRYEMLNRSALSQQAIGAQPILDAIEPLLGGDCHVIANTAWHNPPHSTGQHGGDMWHIDAGPHIPLSPDMQWPAHIPHPVFAIGAHIYLQPCALEDGPTGVIPGSHCSGLVPPAKQMLDDNLQYQGQGVVPIIAEAGDVGMFVSDVWHRRMPTLNGDHGRFFLQVHYARRDIAQRIKTTKDTNQLTDESIARATTPREKTLIGLHPPFFYDG